jgi:organic radical activating enzyme
MDGLFGVTCGAIDFPGRLAFTLFFRGCNLACPWCHNAEVMKGPANVTLEDAVVAVRNLKGIAPTLGVVFSGGEPSVSADFEKALERLQPLVPLAIHTNGLALPMDDENPFQAVILSIKGEECYPDLEAAHMAISAALSYYDTAIAKEVRVVEGTHPAPSLLKLAQDAGWPIRTTPMTWRTAAPQHERREA